MHFTDDENRYLYLLSQRKTFAEMAAELGMPLKKSKTSETNCSTGSSPRKNMT